MSILVSARATQITQKKLDSLSKLSFAQKPVPLPSLFSYSMSGTMIFMAVTPFEIRMVKFVLRSGPQNYYVNLMIQEIFKNESAR